MRFTPPPLPSPRQQYTTSVRQHRPPGGGWGQLLVRVWHEPEHREVAHYLRNYPSLQNTFEPFRQDGRPYALISRQYTSTAVLDLTSGKVIAEEQAGGNGAGRQLRHGFCPVGFYVPDWHDVHDGSVQPGDEHWDEFEDSWPCGDFGFVAGCYWGDDARWKVQYLDLSRIREGVVVRDDRFGYLELPSRVGLAQAIMLEPASRTVELAVAVQFDLTSGRVEPDSISGLGPTG